MSTDIISVPILSRLLSIFTKEQKKSHRNTNRKKERKEKSSKTQQKKTEVPLRLSIGRTESSSRFAVGFASFSSLQPTDYNATQRTQRS